MLLVFNFVCTLLPRYDPFSTPRAEIEIVVKDVTVMGRLMVDVRAGNISIWCFMVGVRLIALLAGCIVFIACYFDITTINFTNC